MPGVSRQFDTLLTGHGCSVVTILGLPMPNWNVYANFQLMAQVTDMTIPHTIGVPPACPFHVGLVNTGWSNVRVWGMPQAHIGCLVDLGKMIWGSPNVYVGGVPEALGPGF